MNTPWQYDETAQVGTDYRNESEVAAYDERIYVNPSWTVPVISGNITQWGHYTLSFSQVRQW